MSKFIYRARFWRDHRWTPAHMSAYLDEELAPRGRGRFARHVSNCAECRRLLAGLRATLQALHRVSGPSAGADARQIASSVRVRLNDPHRPG
jgi:anti-sigma factor RsiW